MAGKQAKLLNASTIADMLRLVARHRHAKRDRVIVLLSVKAGLRAGEIAGLTWPMVLDPLGRVGELIELHDTAAKMGSGRTIPIHPLLRPALTALRREGGGEGPIVRSERGDAMNAGSIVNWFRSLYRELGLAGCSSHSGRRTFVTNAARRVHKAGGSLRDVQQLAGHRSIEMTQRYIEGDTLAKRRLINLL